MKTRFNTTEMLLRLLTLIFCLNFCSFTSCDDECFAFFGGGLLEVDLDSPAQPSYSLGDTLWVKADFLANLSETNREVTISENGGLFVSRLFQIGSDSSSVVAARTAFTPLATQGTLIPEADNNDPAASILRFTCPNGRCGFRQGFRLNSPGQYLLQVSGSGYDVVNERLNNCELDAFGQTNLNAESNLAGVPLIYPLDYPGGNQSFFTEFIDTSRQRNLLFFSVE